ncbi:MAG: hypothetical protein R6U43_08585, partial [Candidatus Krumholzibacteriales bacterium]
KNVIQGGPEIIFLSEHLPYPLTNFFLIVGILRLVAVRRSGIIRKIFTAEITTQIPGQQGLILLNQELLFRRICP